jgi:hypothetical protein
MPSSKRIKQIFIYLLATVGIIFLILLLVGQAREGFQTVSTENENYRKICLQRINQTGVRNCKMLTIDSGTVWLCNDEDTAKDLLECDNSFASTLDPSKISFLNLKDSVCYLTADEKIYVCYNRPPLLGVDSDTNAPEFINPALPGGDDPVPSVLEPQYNSLCGSYQASYSMMHRGISSISTNLSQVNANLGILSNVYNTMNNLKTSHCSSGNLGQPQLAACNELNNSVGFFQNSITSQSTINIVNTLSTGLYKLISLRDNELTPAYSGLGCTLPTF